MALQLKFFVVPVGDIERAETQINRFLRSVRVVSLQREFVAQAESSFWSVAVEYLVDGRQHGADHDGANKRSKVDYRNVLSPEAFALFAKLRQWRKQRATQEALPVFTIFTNEQLAVIAENKIATKAALQQIDGIGEARIARYADDVIRIVTQTGAGEQK